MWWWVPQGSCLPYQQAQAVKSFRIRSSQGPEHCGEQGEGARCCLHATSCQVFLLLGLLAGSLTKVWPCPVQACLWSCRKRRSLFLWALPFWVPVPRGISLLYRYVRTKGWVMAPPLSEAVLLLTAVLILQNTHKI